MPAPEPEDEMGSLKGLFNRKAVDLLREARKKDKIREKALADAFAAATANHLKATLVAGKDADFEG